MGERLNGIQEVGGSIPPGSTNLLRATRFAGFVLAFLAKQDALRSLGRRWAAWMRYVYLLQSKSLRVNAMSA
jgi:hypothetical protein